MGLLWQDVSSAVSFDANFLIFLIFMFDYPFIHRLIRVYGRKYSYLDFFYIRLHDFVTG